MNPNIDYDQDQIQAWMRQALGGDEEARWRLEGLEMPHALSPDGTALVVLQFKDASVKPGGAVRILNKAPEPGGDSHPCADIYRCGADGGGSWTHIPVPRAFALTRIVWVSGDGPDMRFAFESADGRRATASLAQMGRSFRGLDLIMQGATEAEIEAAFYAMEHLDVPPPPVKRTSADNPPIDWEGRGRLTFDELLQQFEGEVKAGERELRVTLDTADRGEASGLLPALAELADGLEMLDASARRYAAEELLDLKNDVWLEEGEAELTEARFAGRMRLESVTLDAGGGATFWYDDGALFAGHTICVERSGDGLFIAADMMG